MKFFDRNSDLSRATDFEDNLRRILHNRRIFESDHVDPQFVTQSIKYDTRPKYRAIPAQQPLREFVQEVTESVFDYETPYNFQQRAWRAIEDAHSSNDTEAVLLTAPTGQGKTSAFSDPLLHKLCNDPTFDQVIYVYPRRALLQDQLKRLLGKVHRLNDQGQQLSIGAWFGSTAWKKGEVLERDGIVNSRNNQFQLASCWKSDKDGAAPLYLHPAAGGYELTCSEHGDAHQLNDNELLLSRKQIRDEKPEIILTTLESLELFALKPNYEVIYDIDAIVFDEVHLYRGIYGSHAHNIIQNIKKARSYQDSGLPLFVGSSATLAKPRRFGRDLFNVSDTNDLSVISAREPGEIDPEQQATDIVEADGKKHFQFLRTAENVGISSNYIQQSMLYGHRILPQVSENAKMLSFIDSLSQINQRHGQLIDADENQALWRYHSQRSDRTWDGIVDETAWDYDFPDFVENPIDIDKAHSKSRVQPNELASKDHILASPLLEVGIDLPDIRAIAQYRPPQNASSFIQRIGRAGREPDEDSYILMFLSQDANDLNLYYRADRFMQTDITTPLNTGNPVAEDIHDKIYRFYKTAVNADWKQNDDEKFFQEYIQQELGYDAFYDFLVNPGKTIRKQTGRGGKTLNSTLADWSTFNTIGGQLERIQKNIRKELSVDEDRSVVQKSDIFDEVKDTVESALDEYSRIIEGLPLDNDNVRSAHNLLADTRSLFADADSVSVDNPEEKHEQYRKVIQQIRNISNELTFYRDIGTEQRNQVNDTEQRVLKCLDKLDSFKDKLDEGTIDELYERSRQVYHLRKSLEAFERYNQTPWGFYSVYACKAVLRAAYQFNRALEVNDTPLDDDVYLVPEDYFGGGGSTIRISLDDRTEEEERTSLFTKYAPYRAVYSHNGQWLNIVEPDFDPSDDPPKMDFLRIAEGDPKEGVIEPEKIDATVVRDVSKRRSQGIIRYCPECFDIISDGDECRKHGKSQTGRIHSDPSVETDFDPTIADSEFESTTDHVGDLVLREGQGSIYLDKVTLEITPAYYFDGRYVSQYQQQKELTVQSGNPKLGMTLQTKGIELDISNFVADVRQSQEEWEQRLIGDKTEPVDVARHTAAHFLLVIVSDIAGVNPRDLQYGYRDDSDEYPPEQREQVYVFERSEGGQGVVDLIFEEIADENAVQLLTSIKRVGFNEQLEADRLCTDQDFVQELVDITTEGENEPIENAVKEFARAQLTDHKLTAIGRLSQELISIADRITATADGNELTVSDAIALKSDLVNARLDGLSVKAAMSKHANIYSDEIQEKIKSNLCPPDIDECRNNLQVTGCTADEQDRVLSYEMLQELLEIYVRQDDDTVSIFGTTLQLE